MDPCGLKTELYRLQIKLIGFRTELERLRLRFSFVRSLPLAVLTVASHPRPAFYRVSELFGGGKLEAFGGDGAEVAGNGEHRVLKLEHVEGIVFPAFAI